MKWVLSAIIAASLAGGVGGCQQCHNSPNFAHDPMLSGRGESQGRIYFVMFPAERERLIRELNKLEPGQRIDTVYAALGQPDSDMARGSGDDLQFLFPFLAGPCLREIRYYVVERGRRNADSGDQVITLSFNEEDRLYAIRSYVPGIKGWNAWPLKK